MRETAERDDGPPLLLPALALSATAFSGWIMIAVVLGAGFLGVAVTLLMILSPAAVLVWQFWRMSPEARVPREMTCGEGHPGCAAGRCVVRQDEEALVSAA